MQVSVHSDLPRRLREKRLAKKPIGFLTTSWCVARELDCKCDNSHAHVSLIGDSNPCGQSPMDFESISLTARAVKDLRYEYWHAIVQYPDARDADIR